MGPFDDIRPYTDDELPAALQRIASWSLFPQVLKFIYPDMSVEEGTRKLFSISSVHQFQATFMNDAIRRIIDETTDGFSFGGLQHLRRGVPYTFVSNHRDITLDAFLLQHVLIEHLGDTSHIVFGQNLLANPVIETLFRSNKLIRMERGGSPRAFYQSLQHLSSYLNYLVTDKRQSVWIAQRNGRAKDGLDITAPAIIKMLSLGGHSANPVATLRQLHIVPMSISYEWDPCDALKATEMFLSRNSDYQKAPGEDMKSIVTGIIGQKGKVHLEIGTPLRPRDLVPPDGTDFAAHIASILDQRIHNAYRLMPSNYAAAALLNPLPASPSRQKNNRFTQRTLNTLKARAEALPNPDMRRLLLEAYAAPTRQLPYSPSAQ